MSQISIKINGKQFSEEVKSNRLLVDFLREDLNLTGTHVGCDTSQCGACNVLRNGNVVKSCSIFVSEADGDEILTIEGVQNDDGSLNFIQEAFQKNHGLQCGFCTPGIIMTTIDLLKNFSDPSEHQIRNYLEGNICRCTGYHNIVKSIQDAAASIQRQIKDQL